MKQIFTGLLSIAIR